eukprot:2930221-Pyramimonas_sp.AAC.1
MLNACIRLWLSNPPYLCVASPLPHPRTGLVAVVFVVCPVMKAGNNPTQTTEHAALSRSQLISISGYTRRC